MLTDYDQHLFIEKGMRGGISIVSKRHAKANYPLVVDYDPEKPSSHILYLDANNLYCWAMSQYFPTGGFRGWMTASSSQKPLQSNQYGLDPAHYYTSPGLSWDALLKKIGVELELFIDYDQHRFIEKGMHGGISIVSKLPKPTNLWSMTRTQKSLAATPSTYMRTISMVGP